VVLALSLPSTPRPAISPLSLHDALPISPDGHILRFKGIGPGGRCLWRRLLRLYGRNRGHLPTADVLNDHRLCAFLKGKFQFVPRSEEHTSELQSRFDLVCRLLLEKKNKL